MNKKYIKKQWFTTIINICKVIKVSSEHKKLQFRVIIIIGNKKGCIGLGIGKNAEIPSAKNKAIKNALKNLITVSITKNNTILYPIKAKYRKCNVIIKPATSNTGLRAGNTIKTICELAGITNISAKQLGGKNILNNARATFKALNEL